MPRNMAKSRPEHKEKLELAKSYIYGLNEEKEIIRIIMSVTVILLNNVQSFIRSLVVLAFLDPMVLKGFLENTNKGGITQSTGEINFFFEIIIFTS